MSSSRAVDPCLPHLSPTKHLLFQRYTAHGRFCLFFIIAQFDYKYRSLR